MTTADVACRTTGHHWLDRDGYRVLSGHPTDPGDYSCPVCGVTLTVGEDNGRRYTYPEGYNT